MLTPIEIQSKVFKSGIGYDKKDVESFMKNVLSSFEILYKENVELKDKMNTLSDGIQYYKSIEKTLQKALVLAERTADETKIAAKEQAKSIEKEAHSKAKIIVSDAKNELDSLHAKTIDLLRQYEMYKSQFKQLAATQMELLNSDCFNINIANLEAFDTDSFNAKLEEEYEYHEKKERQLDSKLDEVTDSNVAATKEIEVNLEAFEFLNTDDLGE